MASRVAGRMVALPQDMVTGFMPSLASDSRSIPWHNGHTHATILALLEDRTAQFRKRKLKQKKKKIIVRPH